MMRHRRLQVDNPLRTNNEILSDDYIGYTSTEIKQSNTTYRHGGCTLPFEYGSDPYLNEDWENVKKIMRERRKLEGSSLVTRKTPDSLIKEAVKNSDNINHALAYMNIENTSKHKAWLLMRIKHLGVSVMHWN